VGRQPIFISGLPPDCRKKKQIYFWFFEARKKDSQSCRLRKSNPFYACDAYLAKELLARDGNFL
jgi:hypothetical protein